MANMNSTATIDVRVRGVEQLQQLQNKLQATSGLFENLKSAISGIALGSFIANAIAGAAALDDIADASGIALQSVIGFSKAVQIAGGNAEATGTAIARFSNYLEDVSNGSKSAYDTFLQLGISLQDLKGLSDEEILKKTVAGLGNMEAGAKRTALGMAIFGKSFASVDFEKLNNNLDEYIAKAAKNAAATKSAADAEEKFSMAVSNLKSAVLVAIEPLTRMIASIDPAKIESLANTIVRLGTAFLAIKGSSYALKLITELGMAATSSTGTLTKLAGALGMTSAMSSFKGGISIFKKEWAELGSTIDRALHPSKFGGADTGLKMLGNSVANLGRGFLRMIPLIGQAVIAFEVLNGAVSLLTGQSIGEWLDEAAAGFEKLIANNFPALAEMINSIGAALGMAPSPAQQEKSGQGAAAARRERELTDPYKAQRAAIADVTDQFEKQNRKVVEQLRLETELLGLSKEQQDARRAQFEVAQRYQDTLDKLTQARDNLTAAELRAGVGANYDEQIAALTKARDLALERVAAETEANNVASARLELTKFSNQLEVNNAKQLQTIRDNIAKSTMGELDRRKYDLEAQARANAADKIASEEQRLNRKLTAEERAKYTTAAMQGLDELKSAEEESYITSRKWNTGWTNAFREYADNATNAAQQAQRVFSIAAQGMEDALMNFIKRGKFEWKNFVQLMVDELLRSQIRQLISNIGGGLQTTGAGLFGGISKLLGFANGGIIPTNGPVVVGERGPELLFGAAGMSVTPNSQLGGSTNVVYNINAVDAFSFKQLVARDPSFIHAVAMAGASTVPSRR